MLIKWKASRYETDRIKRVECTRETEKAVWVLEYPWTLDGDCKKKPPKECRRNKYSTTENYFDTWEDAHAFLLAEAESRAQGVRVELQRAISYLGSVKGMKKPDDLQSISK